MKEFKHNCLSHIGEFPNKLDGEIKAAVDASATQKWEGAHEAKGGTVGKQNFLGRKILLMCHPLAIFDGKDQWNETSIRMNMLFLTREHV